MRSEKELLAAILHKAKVVIRQSLAKNRRKIRLEVLGGQVLRIKAGGTFIENSNKITITSSWRIGASDRSRRFCNDTQARA